MFERKKDSSDSGQVKRNLKFGKKKKRKRSVGKIFPDTPKDLF